MLLGCGPDDEPKLKPADERRQEAIDGSGQPAQAWTVDLEAGSTYGIELISDVFDPVLYLDGPGLSGVLTDDDSLGNGDARIVYQAGLSGTMRIAVSAYTTDAAGSYRLRVFRIVE